MSASHEERGRDEHWREELLSAEEMRAAEAMYAGPTIELMERAGRACAEAGVASFPGARRWAVHCGGGANGGDGFVAARHLARLGRAVELVVHVDPDRLSGDTAESYRRCGELAITQGSGDGADALIDALLGTGFEGALRPAAASAIGAINDAGALIVSVDVPSGVDASSGEVPGEAVRADLTVTFHRRKIAHAIAPAARLAGRVLVVDIGLGGAERSAAEASLSAAALVGETIVRDLPVRGRDDSKYTAGSVLVVGGSLGMTGAPALTALGVLRAGSGVARVCVPASLNPIFEAQLLEVMTLPCPDLEGALTTEAAAGIVEASARVGAVVIGPGLGRAETSAQLVRDLLDELDVPVVLDADGLWALNGQLASIGSRKPPTILTPHAGELGRLLGRESAEIEARRLAATRETAERAGSVVLLKGADTIVVDGARSSGDVLVSELGTPGLATAGTGDVLSGVIATAVAKGLDGSKAAALGAALCGLAARSAGSRIGSAGLIATDIAHAVPAVVSAAQRADRRRVRRR